MSASDISPSRMFLLLRPLPSHAGSVSYFLLPRGAHSTQCQEPRNIQLMFGLQKSITSTSSCLVPFWLDCSPPWRGPCMWQTDRRQRGVHKCRAYPRRSVPTPLTEGVWCLWGSGPSVTHPRHATCLKPAPSPSAPISGRSGSTRV